MLNSDRENPMTSTHREEIKSLCQEADIPDKSGELYTRRTAQLLIKDLRRKACIASRA